MRGKNLEGNLALQARIGGQIHHPHATAAELTQHRIVADVRGKTTGFDVGQTDVVRGLLQERSMRILEVTEKLLDLPANPRPGRTVLIQERPARGWVQIGGQLKQPLHLFGLIVCHGFARG